MWDEVAFESLLIAGGVMVVVCVMMLIVWFVSTREERQKKMKYDDSNQNSSIQKGGAKKKKLHPVHSSPRKRKDATKNGDTEGDESDQSEIQLHSILKKEDEPSPRPHSLKVGFQVDEKPKSSSHQPVDPPTPYPLETKEKREDPPTIVNKPEQPKPARTTSTKQDQKSTQQKTDSKLPPSKQQESKPPPKQQESKPPPKPPVAKEPTTESLPPTTKHQPATKKPTKPKTKTLAATMEDGSPTGSQIADMIADSSLTDDDIQVIMGRLLEKKDDNEEWEATTRSENVKTLKKSNQELLSRCADAENAAKLYSGRIKELSAELKQEKMRHSQSEANLQSRMSKVLSDNENFKQRVDGYKMEIQKMKDGEHLQALQQENQDLTRRINLLIEENQMHTSKLSASQDSKDINRLKNELKSLKTLNSDLERKNDSLSHQLHQATERPIVHEEVMVVDEKPLEADQPFVDPVLFESLQQEKDRLLAEKEQILAEKGQLAAEKDHILAELALVKEELNDSTKTLHDVRSQLEQVEQQADSEREQLQATVTRLENEKLAEKVPDNNLPNGTEEDETVKLTEENEALKADKKDLEQRINDLKKKNTREVGEIAQDTISKQQQSQKDFLKRLFPSISIDEMDSFDNFLQQFEAKVLELSRERDEEIGELKEELDRRAENADNFRDTLSNSLNKFEELRQAWERQEEEHSCSLEAEQKKREEAEKRVADAMKEARGAKADLAALQDEVEHLNEEVRQLSEEKESFHRRASEIDNVCLVSQQEVESLKSSLQHEIMWKEKAHDELQQEQKISEQLRKEKEGIENEMQENVRHMKQLEEEIADLKKKVEDKGSEQDLDKVQQEKLAITEELERKASHVKELEDKVDSLEKRLDEATRGNEGLTSTNQDLEKRLADSENKAAQFQQLQDELNDLRTKLEEANKLNEAQERLEADKAQLADELRKKSDDFKELETEKEELARKLVEANKQVEILRPDAENLTRSQQENTSLAENLEKKTAYSKQLEEKMSALETKLAEGAKLVESLKLANQDLHFRLAKTSPPAGSSTSSTSSEV